MKNSKLITALLLCASLTATAFMFGSCGGDGTTDETTADETIAGEITSAETEAPKVTDFEITTPPTKTVYNVGEELDLTGMVCSVIYDDGTKEEYTDYKVSQEGPLGSSDTSITIRYNTRYRATLEITVNLDITLPGTGTAEDPYMISTPEEFVTFQALLAEGERCSGKYFALANDITVTDASTFVPFHDGRQSVFDGTLDGRGHVLKAVMAARSEKYAVPFFYYVSGTILNTGFDTTTQGCDSGSYGIAREYDSGSDNKGGTMVNCYLVGSIYGNDQYTSMIGGTTTSSKLSNLFINVAVSGYTPGSSTGITVKGNTNTVTNAYYVANGCAAQCGETAVTDTTTVADLLNATLADAATVAGVDASALCSWETNADGNPVLIAKNFRSE